MVLNTIITTLYYVLPGLIANMVPIFVRNRFKFLAIPVDFNKKLFGKKIFGTHKTYRGFIFGILAAILVSLIQMILYDRRLFLSLSYIDYGTTSFIYIGAVLGFGALFGDLIRSFFKRRANLKEGAKWFPWDQIDYVLGIAVFSFFIKPMSWQMIIILLLTGPILSILATRTGYLLKIRKEKW